MDRPDPTIPAALAALHTDAWTDPFWAAAAEHRLVAPRCTACGEFRMPPGPFCHRCRAQDVDWVDLPGQGTVYTFTVTRKPLTPALADAVPYTVAVVDLAGAPGARLVGNVIGDPDALAIGLPVEVAWDDVADGVTIPRWRPATPSS